MKHANIKMFLFISLSFLLGWSIHYMIARVSDKLGLPGDMSNNIKEVEIFNSYDTLLDDDLDLIVRHANNDVTIKRKFISRYTFKDFSVDELATKNYEKDLNFSACRYGALYKSAALDAVKKGAVFAGHYAVAKMGCGTNCYTCVIVDLTTGNVFDAPEANTGYDFKVTSKLLIVNPPDSNGYYIPCPFCKPVQYLWTGNQFKRISQLQN